MSKILLIDDKMDNLVTLSALLNNLMPGCAVITAQHGMEGIEKTRSELPDAILMDVKMPGMDGFETCRRLKSDESTKHIPVIMVTAIKTDPQSRIKGLEIGADAFLAKPIDQYELVSQVNVALRIKKAEDALREERDSLERLVEERTASLVEVTESSRDFLENVINAIADPVFVKDDKRRFVLVNDALCAIVGRKRESLLGEDGDDMFPEEEVAVFRKMDTVVLDTGEKNVNEELLSNLSTGEVRTIITRMTRYIDPNGKRFLVGVIRDITERRQAEAEQEKLQAQLTQAQKMESVGRLAGGVAHDYNNMLSVILGYTELSLEKLAPDDPLRKDLQEILAATRRSADITRQLMAFSRQQPISPKVLDLNETVERMLKMLRQLIGEDINLSWNPGTRLSTAYMDPTQVDQVLVNLCINARDAIDDVGKISIETDTLSFDPAYCADNPGCLPGDFVLLAVSDDGCGMNPETMGKIFEPFFTTKQIGKGTGLGLATVHGIVKQNNGFINVYSEPDQGTTFRIYLPRHKGAQEQALKESKAAPDARGNETLLLVEDEPTILRMTTMMLDRLGYRVLAAGNPEQAIALAGGQADKIDLLITDVVMPEMNGRELSGRLSEIYPGIKVLFMSGYTADVIAHRGVLEKGVNFIQKPFSKKDLAVKVREALEATHGVDG